jgi:uncharacterized zinc-type alcohol dehydrogenase-like protein
MVGEVVAVGDDVGKFRTGDQVVVGTIIDSCRRCSSCQGETEPYCLEGPTTTYNGRDRHDGSITRGGYSREIVADQRFVYPMPHGLDPASVAPLLCAGITTWSPLRHWQVGPGKTVGIVGLGGLGHMGLKFARALGAHVVQFTTSPSKAEAALALGAHEVVVSSDEAQMAKQAWRLDFILDSASSGHDLTPYLRTLKLDGTLCTLGIPAKLEFQPVVLTYGRRRLSSSGVGGTRDTREMLDFCARHKIGAEIEMIRMDQINEGFDRLERNDVRYRLVIDMATL